MNIAPRFHGRVENGKLQIFNFQAYQKWIQSLKGDVDVTVRKRRRDRTLSQNAYYWVCLTIIAEELGYYPEEMHDTFKSMFLVDRTGPIPIVRSTTRLNTVEFSEYFEKIAHEAAKMDIVLPDPDGIN